MGLTVLTADLRMVDPASFRTTTRQGRRAGSRTVVTHLLLPEEQQVVGVPGDNSAETPSPLPTAVRPRIGFVVSKAVGGSVARNLVKRRLRHLLRDRVDVLPAGARLVVRAQASAATASSAELAADLDRCLHRVLNETGGTDGSGERR